MPVPERVEPTSGQWRRVRRVGRDLVLLGSGAGFAYAVGDGVLSPYVLAAVAVAAALLLPYATRPVLVLLAGVVLPLALGTLAWGLHDWQCADEVNGKVVVRDC